MTLALIDVGGNYIVPRTPTTYADFLFEGGNGISQRYDAYIAWLLATIALLAAGLIFATLAFGLRAPPARLALRQGAAADLAVVVGAAAVLAGTLLAPETFAFDRFGVRYGVGTRHGYQPLVLACAAMLVIAGKRSLPSEFVAAAQGVLMATGAVILLYFVGITLLMLMHSPRDMSAGVAVGLVGSLAVIVGAFLGAGPWRHRLQPAR